MPAPQSRMSPPPQQSQPLPVARTGSALPTPSATPDPTTPLWAARALEPRRGSVVDSIYSDDTDESGSVALPSPPAARASDEEEDAARRSHRLHRVKKEIYDTEVTYCAGLAELSDFYLEQMKQMLEVERKRAGARSPHVDIFDEVFGSLMNIRACNDVLLKDMRAAIAEYQCPGEDGEQSPEPRESPPPSAIATSGDFSGVDYGRVFVKNFRILRLYAHNCGVRCVLRLYASYINSYDAFAAYLKQHGAPAPPADAAPSRLAQFLANRDGMITEGLAALQKTQRELERARPLGDSRRDVSLWGYLITPIQRLMRYRMMLQQLVGYSPPDDPSTQGSCDEITAVCSYCNQKKRESDATVKMEKVTKGRDLGSLGRLKTAPCRVFLFSDVILCVKRSWGLRSGRSFQVRLEDVVEVLDEFPTARPAMWSEGVIAAQRQWARRSTRKGSIIGINLNDL
eukprot:gene54927-27108_t